MSPALPVRIARTHSLTPPLRRLAAACLAALALSSGPAVAQTPMPGRSVETFLEIARETSPDFAAMRLEAAAVRERPASAGALPDPTFRMELMDVTNAGMEASPSLNPSKIGATKYTFMQMLPWFGKRDAMREAAEADAQSAASRADLMWLEVAMRIKSAYEQYYLA